LISIVDDDAHVRGAIRDLVQSLGYAALSFSSADDFLRSGRAAETACLISDIQMPGLSGLELRDCLLAQGHKMPVIFVSAFPERYGDKCLKAGAVGFLAKPFRDKSLIECLESVLSTPPSSFPCSSHP
jgi:FixJ family two-component response regulator